MSYFNGKKILKSYITLGNGGGASLNVAYGTTPPQDTSKIWLQCEEPTSIDIANYLNSVTKGEITYLKNNYSTVGAYCLFKYSDTEIGALYSKLLRTYDINTGEITNELSFTPKYTQCNSCYRLGNDLYYTSNSNGYVYLEKLDLTTLETSVLIKFTDYNMYSNYMFMRENDNNNIYICTCYLNNNTYYIHRYSISENTYIKVINKSGSTWTNFDYMNYTQCYYNDYLYVFYLTTSTSTNKAYKLNLDNGEVTQLTNVEALSSITTTNGITASGFGSSYVIDNYMYIVGCDNSNDRCDRIIRINLTTDEAEITNEYLIGKTPTGNYNRSIVINNIAYIFRPIYTGGGYIHTIQKYTYKQELEQNKAVITTDTLYNNNVKLIASDKLNLSVNFHNAYKGNADNLAEKVNAYYHNGYGWVGINCEDYAYYFVWSTIPNQATEVHNNIAIDLKQYYNTNGEPTFSVSVAGGGISASITGTTLSITVNEVVSTTTIIVTATVNGTDYNTQFSVDAIVTLSEE